MKLAQADRVRPPLRERFAADAGRDDQLGSSSRPVWRGRIHLIGLCLAFPSLAALLVLADSARARIGVSVYGAGLCSMFAVSTIYHRWVHNLRARAAWRRADHATIFAAIAGSATPIVLLVMPSGHGIALLCAVWAVSVAGAIFKVGTWKHGDTAGSILYAAVSLLAAFALPALWRNGGVGPAVFFILSGALYILGAGWFAQKWPTLRPAVFSYHEVWHLFTVAAAGCHFVAVWAIAT